MKPIHIVIAVVALALVGGVLVPILRPNPGAGPVNKAAVDFKLTKIGGSEGRLSDYQGRVVLVNFWASWCGTCREEMPDIVRTYQKYQNQGFTVLGLNYGEDEAPAKEFTLAYAMTFPTFLDPGRAVASQYGVVAMPSSYLIDKKGLVRDYVPGKLDFAKLAPAIESLLQETK